MATSQRVSSSIGSSCRTMSNSEKSVSTRMKISYALPCRRTANGCCSATLQFCPRVERRIAPFRRSTGLSFGPVRTFEETRHVATGTGTKEDPWQLKTPPGTSEYQMWLDDSADPPAIICQVGGTQLKYQKRA